MNREIKFRAWDKERKEMLEGFRADREIGVGFEAEYCPFGFIVPHHWRAQDKLILMQFTGLKDKNGKEIYEGDIIEAETSPGRKERGAVVWLQEEDPDFYFGWHINWFDTPTQALFVIKKSKPKIIGNIYENPIK